METQARNGNLLRLNRIYQAVFLANSRGPAPAKFVPERFRLANTGKGIALHVPDRANYSKGLISILFDPPG